jgi:transcriptional regulator GlxA family with amidase domain
VKTAASRVVFVLIPGVHLLDLAGPAQVFGYGSEVGHPYELLYVGDQPTVMSHQGVAVQCSTEIPTLTPQDLIVVPGWRADHLAQSPRISKMITSWMVAHHGDGGSVVSICAGAEALGRARLLDGRRCTTHHDLQDELAERYPRATVVKDVLFVEDSRVLTSAGIASGIDLALHIMATRHGPAIAARLARLMVVYARRNGAAEQHSRMLTHRLHLIDVVHRAQDVIEERFDDRLALADLASISGVSERTLTRSFQQAIGMTPLQYQQMLRMERVEYLLARGSTLESAASAVGFSDARMLRRLRSNATGRNT